MNGTNLCESVCSLCGKPLSCTDDRDIIMEYISGSNYFFDNKQWLVIFKRFNHFYGNDFSTMIQVWYLVYCINRTKKENEV